MKIKEILIESFKSPFFNLLAIANLILFATSVTAAFPVLTNTGKLTMALNLPALVTARILAGPLYQSFALVPPLIYLQWIFIGAFARLMASRIELKTDQIVFSFHLPRLNIRAAATASAENANVIAQYTPCGPKP